MQALIKIHFELRKQQITVEMEVPCVHFVETAASLLQEMPSLIHRDYNVSSIYHGESDGRLSANFLKGIPHTCGRACWIVIGYTDVHVYMHVAVSW